MCAVLLAAGMPCCRPQAVHHACVTQVLWARAAPSSLFARMAQVVEAVVFLCALSFADENLPVLRNEDIGNLVASVVQRYPDNEEIEEFGPRLISNL